MKLSISDLSSGAFSIGFMGLGRSCRSILSMLPYGVNVTLRSDSKIKRELIPPNVNCLRIFEGAAALSDITEDVLILSPSVRRDRRELIDAERKGVVLSSDHELFFEAIDAPALCVSGSSGKSTTAALTQRLINFGGGDRAVLCGNVGYPMLQSVREDAAAYVCELSSFMLMSHKAQVRRSAITGISPNHLDWHRSFAEYREAKLSLLSLSEEIVIPADDEILSRWLGRRRRAFGVFSTRLSLSELTRRHKAKIYLTLDDGYICRNGERIVNTLHLQRREEHNIRNMMCAVLLAEGFAPEGGAEEAFRGFGGLPHRCETVAESGHVQYIDSSIDTTPERCALTVESVTRPQILLLGGRGKGLGYESIIDPVRDRARMAVCFGEEGERIGRALLGACAIKVFEKFSDAVRFACAEAHAGDAVLLSPACTSYDEFESFEERGEAFSRLVSEHIGRG